MHVTKLILISLNLSTQKALETDRYIDTADNILIDQQMHKN